MIVIIEITFEKQVKVNERHRSPHIDPSAFSATLSSVLKNMINSDFLTRQNCVKTIGPSFPCTQLFERR